MSMTRKCHSHRPTQGHCTMRKRHGTDTHMAASTQQSLFLSKMIFKPGKVTKNYELRTTSQNKDQTQNSCKNWSNNNEECMYQQQNHILRKEIQRDLNRTQAFYSIDFFLLIFLYRYKISPSFKIYFGSVENGGDPQILQSESLKQAYKSLSFMAYTN